MAVRFNADEIFEIAERIEINGAKFYSNTAKKFDGAVKETLEKLASMEHEHRIIFATMRSTLSNAEAEDALYDPDEDVKKYLHAIADGKVFTINDDPSTLLNGAETTYEILRMAIGLEKDSIIFYLGMKEMVPEKLGKGKIEQIIQEEKSHILILSDLLKTLCNS